MAIKVKTPASSPASDPKSKRRRLRRRILIWSGAVIGILLAIVFLLPIWASTERGRAFVLAQINKKLNGTVDCADWRLNWFRSIKIDGVTLWDANGHQIFQCAEIRTDMTLLSFLCGSHALGNLQVFAPTLVNNKYEDGSNDLGRILGQYNMADPNFIKSWLDSMSGSIKIEHADITLGASGINTPLHLQNVMAEIPIASPQSRIHIFIHAGDQTNPDMVAAEGNLRPLNTWLDNPAALLQDIDMRATNLPTAALARWFNLDPRWKTVLGPSINSLRFTSDPTGNTSIAEFAAEGANGSIKARVQLESHDGHLAISVPNHDFYVAINGRMAEPLAEWLKYVNPLFLKCVPGSGTVTLSITSARLDFGSPQTATASAQVFCNRLQLNRGGFLNQILDLAMHGLIPDAAAPIDVIVPPFRIQIADEQLACDDFTVTLPPSKSIHFAGATGMDGSLHLRLNFKLDDFAAQHNSLGSGTVESPVSGTIDTPKLSTP